MDNIANTIQTFAQVANQNKMSVFVMMTSIILILTLVNTFRSRENFEFPEDQKLINDPMQQISSGEEQEEEHTLDSYFEQPDVNAEAQYVADAQQNQTDSQNSKLNSSEFLPQELNQDWFDKDFNTVQEIDQETLIDVSKYSSPIDTVGQTLKNPSYDIRGNISNPKSIISPFLNSSIEPDNNIKTWC